MPRWELSRIRLIAIMGRETFLPLHIGRDGAQRAAPPTAQHPGQGKKYQLAGVAVPDSRTTGTNSPYSPSPGLIASQAMCQDTPG